MAKRAISNELLYAIQFIKNNELISLIIRKNIVQDTLEFILDWLKIILNAEVAIEAINFLNACAIISLGLEIEAIFKFMVDEMTYLKKFKLYNFSTDNVNFIVSKICIIGNAIVGFEKLLTS
jgi:hypothetical protein